MTTMMMTMRKISAMKRCLVLSEAIDVYGSLSLRKQFTEQKLVLDVPNVQICIL